MSRHLRSTIIGTYRPTLYWPELARGRSPRTRMPPARSFKPRASLGSMPPVNAPLRIAITAAPSVPATSPHRPPHTTDMWSRVGHARLVRARMQKYGDRLRACRRFPIREYKHFGSSKPPRVQRRRNPENDRRSSAESFAAAVEDWSRPSRPSGNSLSMAARIVCGAFEPLRVA